MTDELSKHGYTSYINGPLPLSSAPYLIIQRTLSTRRNSSPKPKVGSKVRSNHGEHGLEEHLIYHTPALTLASPQLSKEPQRNGAPLGLALYSSSSASVSPFQTAKPRYLPSENHRYAVISTAD
ncbi:hypothetical protein V6N12_052887 [Hibiscus sabdariffa]|uniref:Uncharacterized protein n=1 Tax=Hibiscus sabdariffa TaxID=183260 RepID=A0ABR2C327_9ROSI